MRSAGALAWTPNRFDTSSGYRISRIAAPSRRGDPRQWPVFSTWQRPSPDTAAGPPRIRTVFRFVEPNGGGILPELAGRVKSISGSSDSYMFWLPMSRSQLYKPVQYGQCEHCSCAQASDHAGQIEAPVEAMSMIAPRHLVMDQQGQKLGIGQLRFDGLAVTATLQITVMAWPLSSAAFFHKPSGQDCSAAICRSLTVAVLAEIK